MTASASSSSVVVYAPLTLQEDNFCLAVMEYGGNLAAAYRAAFATEDNPHPSQPVHKAQQLIARPEIAKRIQELAVLVEEHTLISIASHMQELANIRDLAKATMQLKTALDAEKSRGVVAGFYKESVNPKDPDDKKPSVSIYIGAPTPTSAQEWAQRNGTEAVIIDNK